MKQFEIGQTYSTRSVCDHNCIFKITVQARTAKTIKTERGTHRIAVWTDSEGRHAEMVKPWGSYSMCPIIDAFDTATLKPDWEA